MSVDFERGTIKHVVVIDAAIERVWQAVTDAHILGNWLIRQSGFSPTEGASFHFKAEPVGHWDGNIQCIIRTVEPYQKLAMTWRSSDPGDSDQGRVETVLCWQFTTISDRTAFTLSQSGFVLPQNRAYMERLDKAWVFALNNLGALLGVGKARP